MTGRKEELATGELVVEKGVLRYESGEDRFRLPLDEIVLFGEYTTAEGPGVDDYFLVFFTRDGSRHDASFYSDGRDAAIAALREYWGAPLSLGLAASASLASRIVWPASHSGQPLFEFHRQPATSFFARLRERIGPTSLEQRFSPAAQQLLGATETAFTAVLDEARNELDRNPGRALEITERAVRLSPGIDADDVTRARLQGRAWKEHGNALYMTGRFSEASEAAERAQAILGSHAALAAERAAATLLMALVANQSGDSLKALALLEECLPVLQLHGVRAKRLDGLEVRAIALFELQRYEEALQTFEIARTEAEELHLQTEIARIDLNRANCFIELNLLPEARRCVERAEELFAALEMDSEVLRARWTMTRIIKKDGRQGEALVELERLRPEFERRGMNGDAAELEQEIADLKGAA